MDHVAIDLGSRKSQICVRSPDGQIVDERRWETWELQRYLAARPKSRVVVETCGEAFGIAEVARGLGHEVRVAPATLVRTLGVGARRTKTDQRDARVLSEVSCRVDLPSVHIPTAESRERKTICGMRDTLVGARTKMVNTVRGWMRGHGRRLALRTTETFAERVRASYGEQLPSYVERQLAAVDALTTEIKKAEKDLHSRAEADETCQRLMTVPGVGPVTSIRFVAALDDVGRFSNAHQVESYLGLVPGESSSSEREQKLSITKAGPTACAGCWCKQPGSCAHAASFLQPYHSSSGLTAWSSVGGSEPRRWRWLESSRGFSTPSGATGRCTTARAGRRCSEI